MLTDVLKLGNERAPGTQLGCGAGQESSIGQILLTLARSDPEKFRTFFTRMRRAQPKEITRACVRHLACSERDLATREMSEWLARDSLYLKLLFDPEFLPLEEARNGLRVMRQADERFLRKLARALDETADPASLIRALGLLEASEDYSAFCLRLCTLTWHPDPRIRSKAVLALCRIRPNRSVIERHMESDDARVRANAVEALWHTDRGNALRLLREALTDSNNRVVMNGILGLYYWKDECFYGKMLEMAAHAGPNFRLSLAWALGQIRDQRAFGMLAALERDASAEVRTRAAASLAALTAAQPLSASPGAGSNYVARTISAC